MGILFGCLAESITYFYTFATSPKLMKGPLWLTGVVLRLFFFQVERFRSCCLYQLR